VLAKSGEVCSDSAGLKIDMIARPSQCAIDSSLSPEDSAPVTTTRPAFRAALNLPPAVGFAPVASAFASAGPPICLLRVSDQISPWHAFLPISFRSQSQSSLSSFHLACPPHLPLLVRACSSLPLGLPHTCCHYENQCRKTVQIACTIEHSYADRLFLLVLKPLETLSPTSSSGHHDCIHTVP
jgi:hypothetical protein